VVQLLGAATGTVRRDPFLARQEFEKNIYPKSKERLSHLLVRIDGELNSLNLTLRIRIPDEELINRVMYNAISSYPHMGDFLIPYKTGEKRKPDTYREFKAHISAYDVAKDPLGKRTPVEGQERSSGQDRREPHNDSKGTKKPAIESIAIAATAPQVKHRQSEKRVTCQLCGKSGHSAKECFSLNKTSATMQPDRQPKHRVHKERQDKRQGVKLAARAPRETLDDDVAEAAFMVRPGKSSRRGKGHSDEVIADSGASIHVVMNENPLSGTTTLNQPLKIQTANGDILIHKRGMWNGVGTAYLHEEQQSQPVTHLFSIPKAVKDGMKVKLNDASTAIVVTHADQSISKFKLENGLYRTTLDKMMKPVDSEEDESPRIGVVTRSMSKSSSHQPDSLRAVDDSESEEEHASRPQERKSSNTLGNLTKRKTSLDIERAKEARALHCAAGHPSDTVLKQMLTQGKYKECSVSARDVDNSNSILGKCEACQMANMPEPRAPVSHHELPVEDGGVISS